jgi:hypothetical protein
LSGRKGQLGEHVAFDDVETAISPVFALPDFTERWKESAESFMIRKKERKGKERKA